jgi:predicted dehydrogenase
MPSAIVVGAGGISNAWLKPLIAENVHIKAMVDLNVDNARNQAEKYELSDTEATDDLGKALADHDCDFVCDLTTPNAHAAVTCQALEAGRHVIGEKPMAGTIDAARRMVETAERTGKLYMVSQSRRWHAGVLDVARATREKPLGQLASVDCDFHLGAHFGGFRAEMDHVLLVDMAIHHFDLARKMASVDPVRVYCEEFNPPGSWFRHGAAAHAVFAMSEGVRFTYRGSWCSEGRKTSWDGDWRLQYADGSVHYEQDNRAEALRATGEQFIRSTEPVDIAAAVPEVGGQQQAIRQLLRYLADGTTPEGECHDNIKSFAMVCAAVESAETRRPVDIQRMLGVA